MSTIIDKSLEQEYREKIQKKADNIMIFFVVGFFLFGIAFAPVYQTWLLGLGVGSINLLIFFIAIFLIKNKLIARNIVSLVLAIFVVQLIGQSHGMAEFHFLFFINIALLILYEDWKIMIPYTVLVIIHHSILFYLQLIGVSRIDIYFINYTDVNLYVLSVHYGLVVLMAIVAGWWTIEFRKRTTSNFLINQRLTTELKNMQKNMDFAIQISLNQFNLHFLPEDKIGEYLLKVQNNFIESVEKDKIEVFRTQGLLAISKILRDNSELEVLAKNLLDSIIKQMNAQQGAVFLFHNEGEHPYLYPVAQQAYSSEQKAKEKIILGDGILGTAVENQEVIYLENLPVDYGIIRTGLGETSVRNVLIIPLTFNQEIIGAIEINSLFSIDKYKIDFLKTVSENIVTTILALQTTEKNKELLKETQNANAELQTREEELLSQEEELKQNMEEMQTIQEELYRKQAQFSAEADALNDSNILRVEFFPDGYIKNANRFFYEKFGYTEQELYNQHHSIFVSEEYKNSNTYQRFWIDLREGKKIAGEFERLAKDGTVITINGAYAPVFNKQNEVISIIKFALDVSESKELLKNSQILNNELRSSEEELRQNMEELQTIQEALQNQLEEINVLKSDLEARINVFDISTILSESDKFGNILYVNKKLTDISQYTQEELIGQPHSLLRHQDMPASFFKLFWETIKKGEIFRGIVKNRKKDGTHYWVDAIISPVLDENKQPIKYIGARYLIEDEILAQKLFDKMCKELNLNQK